MDATQATVKVGGFAINRSHADYPKLKIVNTLLGGYFGSRLMQVIREQKGLTYGIGSSIVSLEHSGYWTVQGDVLLDKVDEVIADIGLEINRLKTELVGEEELTMIKNYLRGDILQQFDGPFTIGDTYRTLADFGMDFSYFNTLQQTINGIDSLGIMEMANKYLDFEHSKITIVGGK